MLGKALEFSELREIGALRDELLKAAKEQEQQVAALGEGTQKVELEEILAELAARQHWLTLKLAEVANYMQGLDAVQNIHTDGLYKNIEILANLSNIDLQALKKGLKETVLKQF